MNFIKFSFYLIALLLLCLSAQAQLRSYGETRSPKADYEQFLLFEGRKIASIQYFHVDSLLAETRADTSEKQKLFPVGTVERIVQKGLLFKAGDNFNANRLYESMRLLRNRDRFRSIYAKIVEQDSTSIVVQIVIKRTWSYHMGAALGTTTSGFFQISNILKLSQSARVGVASGFDLDNPVKVTTVYAFKNLRGSLIDAAAKMKIDRFKRSGELSFERDIIPSVTRWAAELEVGLYREKAAQFYAGENVREVNLLFLETELWGAYIFKLRKLNRKRNGIQLVFSGRASTLNHFHNGGKRISFDEKRLNEERLHMLGLTVMNSTYYQEWNAFELAEKEQIPKGISLSLIGGVHYGYSTGNRLYAGLFPSWSHRTKKQDYWLAQMGYSGFFNVHGFDQTQLMMKASFFTRYIPARKWGFRHFFEMGGTLGFNSFPELSIGDFFSRSDQNRRTELVENYFGSREAKFRYEIVCYQPMLIKGIRSAVYAFGITRLFAPNQLLPQKLQKSFGYGFGLRVEIGKIGLSLLDLSVAFYPESSDPFNNFRFDANEEKRGLNIKNPLKKSQLRL